MRRRALHLASLLLLLATLGAAEGSVRDGDLSLGAHYITVLLAQQEALHSPGEPHTAACGHQLARALPAAALAESRSVWTVRPPAAHSLLQHAVTGSSL